MPTVVPSNPDAPCEQTDPVCFCDCNCGCSSDDSTGVNGDCEGYSTEETSIRYLNGEIRLDATDIEGTAFCSPWKHTRVYSNQLSTDADVGQGYNWLVFTWPYLVQLDGGAIALVRGTLGSLWFDLVDGVFVGRFCAKTTLVLNSTTHQYTVTLPGGVQLVFNDFVQTTYPQGLFYQQIQPGGVTTTATTYTSGQIGEVQRSGTYAGTTLTESFVYTYTSGQLSSLLLRRQHTTGGSWENIRQALYDYYGSGSSFGSAGDLQRVRIQAYVSGSWSDIDTTAYRYYVTVESNGFVHGLKYVINPLTFARMVGASINPLTAANSVISAWADHYYEYNTDRSVSLTAVEGGTESTTFVYTRNPTAPSDYNDWVGLTVVTLPDGSQIVVFTNKLGQYILTDNNNGGTAKWLNVYQYDSCARRTLHALPSAVSGYTYDPRTNTFYYTLYADIGLIELIEYYTGSGSGGVSLPESSSALIVE